ncbi:hypothetical protein PYW08_014306 [Mythimna loreyi]|uniref:Uncharacterized protein n=1 Tax=Mythimna loreyi TaxID=667449 RepID=A0ACC2R7G0_9NEOP|nr:hypothetical protein PYW08_014306 [Mythimna loreyi]
MVSNLRRINISLSLKSTVDLVFIYRRSILISSLVNSARIKGHKMQLPLILLAILGLAVATPVDLTKLKGALMKEDVLGRNSALENTVLNLLEDLRQTMLTGNDDVPVLDPLEIDNLHLDGEILPIPDSHVDIKDLRVQKLSTFVVDQLSVNTLSLRRYRLEFNIQIPVLEALAAHYDLSLAVAGTNIFGNGDAKVDLIEPRVFGTLVLGPRITIGSGLFLQITSSDVHLSLKGFESQINGLMNDPAMSDFINTFLKHFVPELLVLHEDEITKFLSDTVQEVGNDILRDINVFDIFG